MAHDYEGIYDLESMDDGEIRELIEQELSETPDLDPDDLAVHVVEGRVTLEGRVGTEAEYQAAEHVVTDLIGIKDVRNDIVIDELRRGEQSEAADIAAGDRAGRSDSGSDGPGDRTSDTAAHLLEDTAGDQFGTSDVSEAISEGRSYNPPDNPVQEGTWSKENH
jgi:hypothetical protein